jgi:hypothetical protein
LATAGILLVGALVPWPISIAAPFKVSPATLIPLTAPDSGTVDRVLVREGTLVLPEAPLLRVRNLELERRAAVSQRISDSLAARSLVARAHDRTPAAAQLDLSRAVEAARLAGLRERIAELQIRAPAGGVVVTPRAQELKGQWFSRGAVVLELGQPDSVEVRIALGQAGGGYVQAGQRVRLLPESESGSPIEATLAQVSSTGGASQAAEARVRLVRNEYWRPGMTGRASIRLRTSNVWGALWWAVRREIRSDVLL